MRGAGSGKAQDIWMDMGISSFTMPTQRKADLLAVIGSLGNCLLEKFQQGCALITFAGTLAVLIPDIWNWCLSAKTSCAAITLLPLMQNELIAYTAMI
jgi:hypothetical protein